MKIPCHSKTCSVFIIVNIFLVIFSTKGQKIKVNHRVDSYSAIQKNMADFFFKPSTKDVFTDFKQRNTNVRNTNQIDASSTCPARNRTHNLAMCPEDQTHNLSVYGLMLLQPTKQPSLGW